MYEDERKGGLARQGVREGPVPGCVWTRECVQEERSRVDSATDGAHTREGQRGADGSGQRA